MRWDPFLSRRLTHEEPSPATSPRPPVARPLADPLGSECAGGATTVDPREHQPEQARGSALHAPERCTVRDNVGIYLKGVSCFKSGC